MNGIFKKAGIRHTPDIVGAATDTKNKSAKRTSNIIFGILLFGLGLFSLLGILWGITLLLTEPFGAATFGYLFGLAMFTFWSFVLFTAALACFSTTSNWFFILYQDRLLYKYNLEEKINSKTYREIEVPIKDVEGCYVLREFREGITVKRVDTSDYYMSIHFQYREESEKRYISLYHLDSYQEINQILSHLQNIQGIPMFFAIAHQHLGEELDDIESLKEAEPITFSGNLKDYNRSIFLN